MKAQTCNRRGCGARVQWLDQPDSERRICLDADSDPQGTHRVVHEPGRSLAIRYPQESWARDIANGETPPLLFRVHNRSCLAQRPRGPRPDHVPLDLFTPPEETR